MRLSTQSPIHGEHGVIFIYDLSGFEFVPMLEEVLLTMGWIERLEDEEKK